MSRERILFCESCDEPIIGLLPDRVCVKCCLGFCDRCEDHGYVEVYSPRPPAFENCPDCGNPFGMELP